MYCKMKPRDINQPENNLQVISENLVPSSQTSQLSGDYLAVQVTLGVSWLISQYQQFH